MYKWLSLVEQGRVTLEDELEVRQSNRSDHVRMDSKSWKNCPQQCSTKDKWLAEMVRVYVASIFKIPHYQLGSRLRKSKQCTDCSCAVLEFCDGWCIMSNCWRRMLVQWTHELESKQDAMWRHKKVIAQSKKFKVSQPAGAHGQGLLGLGSNIIDRL